MLLHLYYSALVVLLLIERIFNIYFEKSVFNKISACVVFSHNLRICKRSCCLTFLLSEQNLYYKSTNSVVFDIILFNNNLVSLVYIHTYVHTYTFW